MKKYAFIILINIAAVIFLFLLLEICIRIFVPEIKLSGTSSNLIVDSLYNDSPGIKSNTSGYSGGAVKQTNGYHAWKYNNPISSNKRKLLFLGDSVTMGICVENDSTFGGIINNGSDGVSIINPSLIGYSSRDYVNVFDHLVKRDELNLKFSSVVIFWTLNDTYSNYPDNKSPGISSNGILNRIVDFFRRNSKAYHFLKNLVSDRPRAYYEYDRQFYDKSNPLFLNAVQNIDSIASACDSLNINFLLVLLPYEYQIRNSRQAGIFLPQDILKDNVNIRSSRILDLREIFDDQSGDSGAFYLYGDGIHFNERGNSYIAGFLKTRL
jgi:lysophospholipase L1-like esterase